jgi:hypothetical protein
MGARPLLHLDAVLEVELDQAPEAFGDPRPGGFASGYRSSQSQGNQPI